MKRQVDRGANVAPAHMQKLTNWISTLLRNRSNEATPKVTEHNLHEISDLRDLVSRQEMLRDLEASQDVKMHFCYRTSVLTIAVNQYVLNEHLRASHPQQLLAA